MLPVSVGLVNPDHPVSEDAGIQPSFHPGPTVYEGTRSACGLPRLSRSNFLAPTSAYGSGSNCVLPSATVHLGNTQQGQQYLGQYPARSAIPSKVGNSRSLSNSTRVGVLIPTFRRCCVSSGKIGTVTPNPRRSTPEPPKFAVAPVTGLRGSKILGRGRPCRAI